VRSGYQPGIRPHGEPVTGRGAILPASRRKRSSCPAAPSSLRSLLSTILQFINGHLSALTTTRDDNADFKTLAVHLKPCASILSITSIGSSFISAGTMANEFIFRFSTKYTDAETGLVVYCGYRYCNPELGIWLNRDPIWEGGGNSYSFVQNDGINQGDYVGLCSWVGQGLESISNLPGAAPAISRAPLPVLGPDSVECG